jgi:glutamyl-tRNA synthetase
MNVRVRFAPSPTGFPHVGNIRTALFNWLFARHHGGTFILRIEDTDVERMVPGAQEAVLEGLRWLGLDWDEGPGVGGPHVPYIQSQRRQIYQEFARRLVDQGSAYYCFCSPQRLEAMRKEQMSKKLPPRYDRICRDLSPEEIRKKEKENTPVVRFRTPLSGETRFNDLLRGEVVFQNQTLDDFVLLKSDGFPTYHLANVVDDHLMEITHILRADEWLSSTPRHLLIYQALGKAPPLFAHLPMILGPDRAKLSKRHGATSIGEFREQGYLPEAMANFLALLGWSLDETTELFSLEELVRHFSLERVSLNPAIFNREKLDWMNGVYIRKLSPGDFARRILPFLERGLPSSVPRPLSSEYLHRLAPLVQERARTLAEAVSLADFFLLPNLEYDPALLTSKLQREKARNALETTLESLEKLSDFSVEGLEKLLRPLAEKLGLGTGPYFGLIRVAVTGRTAAPPLFQTMAILGKERCLERLERALRYLS